MTNIEQKAVNGMERILKEQAKVNVLRPVREAPDPLVDVLKDADDMVRVPDAPSYPEAIRAALAKRGGRIVFDD